MSHRYGSDRPSDGLRIAFLDLLPTFDYVVSSPRTKPLGGSQSAMCYLAEELVRLGHSVAFYNQTSTPQVSCGVQCYNIAQTDIADLIQYDALIFLNGCPEDDARAIREIASPKTKLLFWSQHLHNQPAVAEFKKASAREAWDRLILCSKYQASGYVEHFSFSPGQFQIIGNAISPAFESAFPSPAEIAKEKPWPPVLCYTSTPFRGLDVLLDAFPQIRASIPGTTLKVFSSMSVYGVPLAQDSYSELYEKCRQTEGVEYVGSVSQTALASELHNATCLAYANTFAENYSIAVLEAMAAGLIVVTTAYGGLPETTFGFAHMVEPDLDTGRFARSYANSASEVLKHYRAFPEEHARHIANQVNFVRQNATWKSRAREWDQWLSTLWD